MKQQPSEQFIQAILDGYRQEVAKNNGGGVTCSGIWDHIVMACLRIRGGFTAMFAWDTRRGEQNRITTIAECIQAGLVPTLGLGRDPKGRDIVVLANDNEHPSAYPGLAEQMIAVDMVGNVWTGNVAEQLGRQTPARRLAFCRRVAAQMRCGVGDRRDEVRQIVQRLLAQR